MNVDTIVELAKEVEMEDPIDWGMLSISEDEAYRLIVMNLLEEFDDTKNETQYITLLATVTKLVVENMVLNLKLLEKK